MNKKNKTDVEISKGLGDKILEASRAGQLLRDCKFEIRNGKEYYLPAIAGQLRALLTDQSGPPNGPLLAKICKEIGSPVTIYCMKPLPIEGAGIPAQFELFGFPMSIEHELEHQEPVPLDRISFVKIAKFDGKTYNIRDILEWFANKNGGAHYSSKIPSEFRSFLQYTGFIDGTDRIIFSQLADITCKITHKILHDPFSWDLFTTVGIKKPPEEIALLIDALEENTGMRIILAFTSERNFIFNLTSLCGKTCEIKTPPIFFEDGIFTIHLELNMNEEFSSVMRIYINGRRCADQIFNFPILVLGDWYGYDVLFNKQEDRVSDQEFSFGISHTFISTWTDNEFSRASMIENSRTTLIDHSRGMVILSNSGHIHSGHADSDLHLKGDFAHSTVEKFISGA